MEFEHIKGIKIKYIERDTWEGKRLRGELLVYLKDLTELPYTEIVKFGNLRFRNHRQNKEIQKEIQNRYHLFLPESSINVLAHRFLDYVAAVHYARTNDIRPMINESEGYVAHFWPQCAIWVLTSL